ncbi:hypothetical protein HC752_16830 [Vibrio sp. S9_S30]|uniref:hypothetical protein n=1 Tax=Vibrio sp. S9_S30 TaxID=2720226 RepID=UPI001680772C|nr:hypothetical protein [Vibrio sp. S9_S30]MBD1558596.1 hypothetical protein [Vibrio sp. S9_S30]
MWLGSGLNPYFLVDEGQIPEKHKKQEKLDTKKIKTLELNYNLLFDLATKRKIPEISKQAKECGTDNKTIYRLLNLYWKYGQTKNALLPAYSLNGGKGKIREDMR